MIKVRAGVDIGGTKVRICLIDESGSFISLSDKIAMAPIASGDDLMQVISTRIKALVAGSDDYVLSGVGVGAPGPLNDSHDAVM
jgi:predicted NBD/HSP70 family sugar kinase